MLDRTGDMRMKAERKEKRRNNWRKDGGKEQTKR
jgi:hypothetical protein